MMVLWYHLVAALAVWTAPAIASREQIVFNNQDHPRVKQVAIIGMGVRVHTVENLH